jgi:heme A synthase
MIYMLKLMLYICFCMLVIYFLFFIKKNKKNMIITILLLGSLIFSAILCSMIIKSNKLWSNVLFQIYVSFVITFLLQLASLLFYKQIDTIISFHEKDNYKNLNKNPIKFLINHQHELKKFSNYIWLFLAFMMLFIVWFIV